MEKSECPFFGKITKTQTPLHKKGGGDFNYDNVTHNFTEKKLNQKYKKTVNKNNPYTKLKKTYYIIHYNRPIGFLSIPNID